MFLSNVLENFLEKVLPYLISCIDIIGASVIFIGLGYALFCFLNKKNESLVLDKTVCLGLDVILCGEILRTIIVKTLTELEFVALLILIRTVLTIVARWKIKDEEKEVREGIAIAETLKKKITRKKNEDK